MGLWAVRPQPSTAPAAKLSGICRHLRSKKHSGGRGGPPFIVAYKKVKEQKRRSEDGNWLGQQDICVGVSERVTDKENRRREWVVKKSKCVWGTARPSGSPRPPGVFFLSILRPWNGSKFTAVSSSLLSSPPSCQLPLISILHLPVVLSSVQLLFIFSSSMPFILVDISLSCLWLQNSHEFVGRLRLQGVSLFRLV